MKVNGITTKLKAKDYMNMLTEQNTSVIGKKIDSKVMALKHGQIVLAMREITSMERSTVLELSSGQMAHLTSANFTTIIFMAKVCTHGQIIENTRANGEPIKCTVKGLSLGQTEESM